MVIKNILKKINHTFNFEGIGKKPKKQDTFLRSSITTYIYYTNHKLIRNNKFFFKYLFLIIKKQTFQKSEIFIKLYDNIVRQQNRLYDSSVRQYFGLLPGGHNYV
jgi:hypothetical protein